MAMTNNPNKYPEGIRLPIFPGNKINRNANVNIPRNGVIDIYRAACFIIKQVSRIKHPQTLTQKDGKNSFKLKM